MTVGFYDTVDFHLNGLAAKPKAKGGDMKEAPRNIDMGHSCSIIAKCYE
jgi:hypothetical protein